MEIRLEGPASIEEVSSQEFNVNEINRISTRYPEVRQESKSPTFALTR